MLAGLLAWPAGLPAAAQEQLTHTLGVFKHGVLQGAEETPCADPTCCVRLHAGSSLSGKGKLFQFYHYFIDFAPRAWHAVQTVCPKKGVTILAPLTDDCMFCLTNPEDGSMSMQEQHNFIFGATPVQVVIMKPDELYSRTDVPLLFNTTYPNFPRGSNLNPHQSSNADKFPNNWSRLPSDMLAAFRQHLHELAGISNPCGSGPGASPACEKTVLIKRGGGYGHNLTITNATALTNTSVVPHMGLRERLKHWRGDAQCGQFTCEDRAKLLVEHDGLWPNDAMTKVMREYSEVFFSDMKERLALTSGERKAPAPCIGVCSRSLPQEFYDEAERFLSERGINYTIAVLETMGITEQVRLFAEAKLVIGQHGAGLSNLVASSRNTRVVETGPVLVPCYSNLAEQLLQPHVESNCTDFCDTITHAVDLAYPEKRLLNLLPGDRVGIYGQEGNIDR